jgi:phosphoadenosine phosphosulfate reductase
MLIDHTLFDVIDKVQIAIDRIRQFEPPEGYYVAFSDGKDSCVVKDLVKRAGVNADYHYNLTTVDQPELVYFIREHHKDVEVHKLKETMWQLIRRKADSPTRKVRWCCSILKEGGGNGRFVITGVRWADLRGDRKDQWLNCTIRRQKGYSTLLSIGLTKIFWIIYEAMNCRTIHFTMKDSRA